MKKVEQRVTLSPASVLLHSDNKRVCGSLRSPKSHRQTYISISPKYYLSLAIGGGTSHTRHPLGDIRNKAYWIGGTLKWLI